MTEHSSGRWWQSRLGEAGHGHDLDITLLEVDDRDQVVYEWDLEGGAVIVHNQAVLRHTGDDSDHNPEAMPIDGACLETDQVLGPELTFLEDSPTFDIDLGTSHLLGSFSVLDPLEGHLESLVNATNRPHNVGTVLDPNRCARVEMDEVFGLDVKAKETPKTVGTSEPPDPVTSAFSRRTRRQL